MLKSLEKLWDFMKAFGDSGFGRVDDFACDIADGIQAEIDRYYLLRPTDTDGNPVQAGGRYLVQNERVKEEVDVRSIGVAIQSSGSPGAWMVEGEQFAYLPPDTQERINADAEMGPKAYCEKYNLPVHTGPGTYPRQLQIADLLQRQRDLCARGDA